MLMLSSVADRAPGCASTFDTKAPRPMLQAFDGGNCLLKVPVTGLIVGMTLSVRTTPRPTISVLVICPLPA